MTKISQFLIPMEIPSGGGGLEWSVVSINTQAENNKGYLVDASLSNIDITLLLNPEIGDSVGVCDFNNSAQTNTITIIRNGEKINGLESNYIIDINGDGVILVYSGIDIGWKIVNETKVKKIVENKGSVSGAQTLNLVSFGSITMTLTGNTQFDLTGTYTSGKVYISEVQVTNGGGKTITWAAKFRFAGGTAPTFTTNGTDSLTLVTRDGGVTGIVFVNGLDIKAVV